MREIMFRGKSLDGLGWIRGYYFKSWDDVYIAWGTTNGKPNITQVDPATVGQYTGMKDKNGVQIYEGDIVKARWYTDGESIHSATGQVIFNEGWIAYTIWDANQNTMSELNGQGYCNWEIEVIGNIHDNPELVDEEGLN